MLKAISLFTGVGGLDFGFETAGFETAVAVEMDGVSCRTLRLNRDWPVIERDIHEVTSKELLRTAKLKPKQADVLIGGPPCQAYSLAGRSRNRGTKEYRAENDQRHYLYRQYLRVLAEHRPPVFVMETLAYGLPVEHALLERSRHELDQIIRS